MNPERRRCLETALGAPVRLVSERETGMSTCSARVTAGGPTIFVKWSTRPLPRQFEAEAAGLARLRAATDAIVIPRVLAFSDANDDDGDRSFLALECIEHTGPGRRRADYDELLGRGLAEIHAVTSDRGYGFELDTCCGAIAQPNGFLPGWIDFFRERRLLHKARLARARGMGRDDVASLERLAGKLDSILGSAERPALIHGDLWSGNVLVATDGRPAFIDPAAYFADREAEFGMTRLFGNFTPRVHDAYREAMPLQAGHEARAPLYVLDHLLNHFLLFGGAYGARAIAIARGFA